MKVRSLYIIVALLFSFTGISAQEESAPITFNYGIKIGFQGVTYNSTKFGIDGYSFNDNTIQSNKVGYFATPFIRLTKDKFYIQTEAAFGTTHYYYDFIDNDNSAGTAEYKLTTYCVKVPLLLGYNFINNENYGMSVYTGPIVKFLFTSLTDRDFSNFKYRDMHEELEKREWFWELGLGIRIYNVIIDFTYDWGFHRSIGKISTPDCATQFISKRSNNVLSFSAGFIF